MAHIRRLYLPISHSLGLLVIVLGICAWSDAAHAQAHIRGLRVDVHGSLLKKDELGIGARLEFALSRSGLINSLDDDLALSFGGEVDFNSKGKGGGKGKKGGKNQGGADFDLTFPVAAQWNFIVKRKFAFFPELGLEFDFDDLFDPSLYYAIGMRWHFKSRTALLVRVTHNRILQLGLTF